MKAGILAAPLKDPVALCHPLRSQKSSLAKSKIILSEAEGPGLQTHRTNRNTKFFPHPPRSPDSLAGPLLSLTAEDKLYTLPEYLKQAPARQYVER